ncbi:MAG: ribonuclease R, partial [Hyphomicrobiales bacterium]|nr:ribonuclease R [Hyphomicrobiales bacterium]
MGKKPKSRSSKRRATRATTDTLPSKAEILEYIQSAPDRIGKREIARAFNIKGGARIALKRILKEMSDEGLISGPRKRITRSGDLPSVCVIEITARDEHGEFIAQPASWREEGQGSPPQILMLPGGRTSGPAPGIGDRILARLERIRPEDTEDGLTYRARVIKRLDQERGRLLGIFRSLHGGAGMIAPIDRKQLKEWAVAEGDTNGAKDGELVRFELGRGGRYGVAKVKIVERLGDPEGQGAISLIAIHQHGIRDEFPDPVLAQAEELTPATLSGRDDMRDLPL